MSKAVLYMSMSLDGFITGTDDRPGIELELVRAVDGPGVQHLRYRVRKEG